MQSHLGLFHGTGGCLLPYQSSVFYLKIHIIMIKETIEIPIFKGTLTVIKDKDLKWVENKYKTSSLDGYGAVSIRNEKKYRNYVVAFEHVDQGIIAHEVVHLVNYIFLDCGIELDRHNDEVQAYFTGWLHEKIYDIVK